MRVQKILVLFLSFLLVACSAGPEKPTDIERLANMLSGEFDSARHMQLDKLDGVSKDERHGWVNRYFVRVEAPEIGSPVLVGSTRYGGEKWYFDDNEFLVWTFEANQENDIVMTPQRFKDLEAKKPFARDPQKLTPFTQDDLVPAISGAACKIVWTPSASGFSGTSEPCRTMSTTHKKVLDWKWGYDLRPDEMFISFAGIDDEGQALDRTPEGKPYKLNRLTASAEYNHGRFVLFNPKDRADYAQAVKSLEAAVSIDPQHGPSHLMLAYAYVKRNKYEMAAKALQNAAPFKDSLSSQDKLWFAALETRIADDHDRDITAWSALVEQYPQDRWAWYELASTYYRMENYAKAVDAIDKAQAAEPREAQWAASYIYYLHSKAHFRLGNTARAIETAEPGVRNTATRRATYYRKAMAQIAAGDVTDPAEALAPYREYSKRDGKVNEPVYLTNTGLFFHELGDFDEAVKRARKGYELSDGAYHSWALGYSMTEQGEPRAALAIYDKAIGKFPDNANLYAGKGWAHYRLGAYKQAEANVQKAQELSARKNSGIERDLKIIRAALADPDHEQVPPMRWFGD